MGKNDGQKTSFKNYWQLFKGDVFYKTILHASFSSELEVDEDDCYCFKDWKNPENKVSHSGQQDWYS